MAWNPGQYLKFGSVRLRPAVDLLNRASSMVGDVNQVKSIIDLGCGTGHISELLCRSFPQAKVSGRWDGIMRAAVITRWDFAG
jgi:trans-aconitate 2-methyltransferase